MLRVKYAGHTYTISPDPADAVVGLAAVSDGKLIATARAWLGAEQWALFRQRHRTLGDLRALVNESDRVMRRR